jgi:uncharacterized YigZ family protein
MKIIKERSLFQEKIQKSEFIAHLAPAGTWQEAKEFVSEINSEHKNATHNCWAYIVGNKGEISHSSDAGEPSGTAGKPILNALMKYDLTNIVCVVTRYFGGVKLGVRGLIEAYGGIAEQAILDTELIELVFKKQVSLVTDYDFFNTLKHRINLPGLEIINTEYSDKIRLDLEIVEDSYESAMNLLCDYENQKKLSIIR